MNGSLVHLVTSLTARDAFAYGSSAVFHLTLLAWFALRPQPAFQLPQSVGDQRVDAILATWAEPQPIEELVEPEAIDARIVVRPARATIDDREFLPAPSLPEPTLAEPSVSAAPSSSAADNNPRASGNRHILEHKPQVATGPPSTADPHAKVSADQARVEESESAPEADNATTEQASNDELNDQTDSEARSQKPPAPASVSSTPQSIGETTELPRVLQNPPPVYPLAAWQRGWQGTTQLRIMIGANGAVENVEVFRSSGHRVLDAAAVRAVRQWRFQPARRNGSPVAMTVRLPIRFSLD